MERSVAGPDVTLRHFAGEPQAGCQPRQRATYRYGDRLLLIKVIPEHGAAWYLVPASECADDDGDRCTALRPVRWVVAPF
jgi:hypothetical protein